MASIDYAYTLEGSPDLPVAIVAPATQDTVVGAVVRLDGRSSFSPADLALTYSWTFTQVPIGSQVAGPGFKALEDDSSVVSFAPDIIGLYVVRLVVNDGSFDSVPVTSEVNTKVILVPQNLGIVPDMSWVWNYLSDFWTLVEQRQRFEIFWSAAVQVIAAEQLKLWQYDYNKSIQDIQEVIQKRWLAYEPLLPLDPTTVSIILADDQAGLNASTFLIDTTTNGPQANQPQLSNLVTVPLSEGNFSRTAYGSSITIGRVLQLGDLSFTMARSGSATRSVSTGVDGAVVPASGTFHGSAFTNSMVGMVLRILSGAAAGSYAIATVTSSSILQVTKLDGSSVSFPLSGTGLSYSIFPKTASYSSFFADQNFVPTRQFPLPWRLSSTLVSTQYDFEAQGVSPGDVLTIQIMRADTQRTSNVDVQIVSVDRGRVGFVFNTDDLVDGVASKTMSPSDQIQVASDLQIPGLMTSTVDGSLVYTDQSLAIKTLVSSPGFKRQVFETALPPTTAINIGPFSIFVTPLQITRNTKILIDDTVKSIPSLQEYINQPQVVEQNGSLFQISESKLFPLDHQPYLVYQNADYIIDNENGISGTCAVTSGSDEVVIPFGDLLDRGIQQGDTINIENDLAIITPYQVVAIIDTNTVQVSPALDFTEGAARFTITRTISGNFIRFVDGVFTKKNPAPPRLWAEVTFFDNGDAIENNFGVLVGVLRSDLSSVGATISYKNAVAGLMYALTNGPTLANLQLSSQILLGLPFTTSAGTITEIDPDFAVNPDGSPLQGRILIAAQDSKGNPTGVTNIYFYPQGRQIQDPNNPGQWVPADPDLSGIAINASTGVAYAVGDVVASFTALSKGTQVEDYLTSSSLAQQAVNQGNTAFSIQQYHSFQLVVNADITTAIDTDLVAQFIKKAKPTYVKLSLALAKALEDDVDVEDSISFSRNVDVDDNVSLSLAVAAALDPQSVESSYLDMEGHLFTHLMAGEDLQTTQTSKNFVSATGGFASTPAFQNHETNWIPPSTKFTTVLQITSGPNQGIYLVDSATNDTTLLMQTADLEGVTWEVQTQANQSFVVYRLADCRIITNMAMTFSSATVVATTDPIFTAGVAPGDWLTFSGGGALSRKYVIKSVDPVARTITLTKAVVESTSGSFTGVILRPGLINKHYGSRAPDTMFTGTGTIGNNFLVLSGEDLTSVPFMQPGDVVVNASDSLTYVIIDYDPSTATVYIQPPLATSSISGSLSRQDRSDRVITMDILDRMPGDSLFLSIATRATGSGGSGPDLTTTSSSATVSTVSGVNFDTGLGAMVGDYLVVLQGSDALRDIGYGAGIFPILTVSGTSLILTRPLTVTNNSPGILYGIQRRRSNER